MYVAISDKVCITNKLKLLFKSLTKCNFCVRPFHNDGRKFHRGRDHITHRIDRNHGKKFPLI